MPGSDRLEATRDRWPKVIVLLAAVFALGLLAAATGARNPPHHHGTTGTATTKGHTSTSKSHATSTTKSQTGSGKKTTPTHTTTTHTTTTATTAATTTTAAPSVGSYPLHTNIAATTFWVGEIFDSSIADGSQACSTYDSQWAYHWSGGLNAGTDPSTDCAGAPIGGCDGQPSGTGSSFKCATEARGASNGYFPKSPLVHPAENPFYLDLPFDDVNDSTAFKERCHVIPWAAGSSQCSNQNFSFMKNHWVAITGPNGNTCYGQVEDAGPSHGSLYHDATYVFGTTNAQPVQGQFNNAGLDVSPALNGCLGFKELDGDSDKVSWRFVGTPPTGPWTRIVTTRQVS